MGHNQSHSDFGGQNCPRVGPQVMTWTHGEGNLILTYDILLRPAVFNNFYNIYKVITLLHSLLFLAFDFAESKVVHRKAQTILDFSSICVV